MRLADFRREIDTLASSLRVQIEANVSGFDADEAAQQARKARAMQDFEFFATTYFPHYLSRKPAELHRYLFKALPKIASKDKTKGARLALAAPRGHAKSTLVSQLFVLWCILSARKRYAVIIMDAFGQAAAMLEAIKAELTTNPRLCLDFAEETGEGRLWQMGSIVTQNNAKVQVFGSGKRMRGLRHGAIRPDLVIGDDLENDENVRNPVQRDKLEDWLNKTVLSLGSADDSMDVIIIGTVLHYDSLLSRLLSHPLWQSRVFKAVTRFPDNMDLWDEWQGILLNQGESAALAFYQSQRRAMEQGAEVGWPDGQPLYALMQKRARDGQAAFDAEQQNDPVQGDNAPFANCIKYHSGDNPNWVYFGACDPSLGKQGAGRDPSAILIGGFDRKSGTLDVIHASIKKRLPDAIIEDIIALQKQYKCAAWAIEAVQFQAFLCSELVKRGRLQGVPVPAKAVTPHSDKRLRIETLQPHMANGLIRLDPNLATLISQLKHFPAADHDDGPDALHMLWTLATSFAPIEGKLVSRSGYSLSGRGSGGYFSGDW